MDHYTPPQTKSYLEYERKQAESLGRMRNKQMEIANREWMEQNHPTYSYADPKPFFIFCAAALVIGTVTFFSVKGFNQYFAKKTEAISKANEQKEKAERENALKNMQKRLESGEMDGYVTGRSHRSTIVSINGREITFDNQYVFQKDEENLVIFKENQFLIFKPSPPVDINGLKALYATKIKTDLSCNFIQRSYMDCRTLVLANGDDFQMISAMVYAENNDFIVAKTDFGVSKKVVIYKPGMAPPDVLKKQKDEMRDKYREALKKSLKQPPHKKPNRKHMRRHR